MPDEIEDKVMRLEEHQMFLERQIEHLSSEVLELSRQLRLAQSEIKRLQAAVEPSKEENVHSESSPDISDGSSPSG